MLWQKPWCHHKNLDFSFNGTVNRKSEGDGKGNSKTVSWGKNLYGAEIKAVSEKFANGNDVHGVFHPC
jgi:hypothetical protein